MNQDAEIKHRCQKMVEMFDGDSFQFFEAEFTLKIAEVTKKGREAVEAGKTEAAAYAMACAFAVVPYVFTRAAEAIAGLTSREGVAKIVAAIESLKDKAP